MRPKIWGGRMWWRLLKSAGSNGDYWTVKRWRLVGETHENCSSVTNMKLRWSHLGWNLSLCSGMAVSICLSYGKGASTLNPHTTHTTWTPGSGMFIISTMEKFVPPWLFCFLVQYRPGTCYRSWQNKDIMKGTRLPWSWARNDGWNDCRRTGAISNIRTSVSKSKMAVSYMDQEIHHKKKVVEGREVREWGHMNAGVGTPNINV